MQIIMRDGHALAYRAKTASYRQSHVPEQVKDLLNKALYPSGPPARMQEENIDIGTRRELSTAIAAQSNNCAIVQLGFGSQISSCKLAGSTHDQIDHVASAGHDLASAQSKTVPDPEPFRFDLQKSLECPHLLGRATAIGELLIGVDENLFEVYLHV
jgi:hypothetical protein